MNDNSQQQLSNTQKELQNQIIDFLTHATITLLSLYVVLITMVPAFTTLRIIYINPEWIKTSGYVIDNKKVYRSNNYITTVKYSVEDKEYQIIRGIGTPYFDVDKKLFEVAYNPNQLSEAKVVETIKTSWFIFVFPFICILFLIQMCVSLIKLYVLWQKLKVHGPLRWGKK